MIEIQANNYKITVVKDIYKAINKFFKSKQKTFSKLFIIVDENSLKYCYPQLVEKIALFKNAEIIEIESGEASKNIEVCTQIWSALSEYGADRKSMIINLGGGVIVDMGGFIASTFKRGIEFVNIPTTLLAQVDASVGGKVGVDLNNIKNEIGLFNNPSAVFVNSDFIKTLPQRQLLSGFSEIIKHALIADKTYFNQLKSLVIKNADWDSIIEKSIRIKNEIVINDPEEKNNRKALNFGHTIAHAIETYSLEQHNTKTLLHGECVAVGMICEAYISNKTGKLSDDELGEITNFILSVFENISIKNMAVERLLEVMKHDKKNDKGDIYFTLLSSIGKYEINKTAKPDLIKEALKYYSEQLVLSK